MRALLLFHLRGKIRVEHGSSVFHLNPGRCRQFTYGIGRSERILDRSQVRQNADLEASPFAPWRWGKALKRLVDHAHLLPHAFGNRCDAKRLQNNDPRCELERAHRFRTVLQVPIEIGAGESDNEGGKRVLLTETLNGRKAAPCMQGDQQIAFLPVPGSLDADLVPQFSEQACPALRSGPVSCMDLCGGGRDKCDLHSSMLRPAGAESCPYVAAIRSIEVPPGIAQQTRLRRPGAA